MSRLTKENRISIIKPFARVPALPHLDLPPIRRAPGSVSNASSSLGTAGRVYLPEGCLITKSIKYTHQLAHWVNAVRDKGADPRLIEEVIFDVLRIVPDENFTLNDSCNLTYLEMFIHASLDIYAFIAVTASSSTLNVLLEMVGLDNDRRQRILDETGIALPRSLDFFAPSVINPELELVALHPEHFLPGDTVLTVYSPGARTLKHYVAAEDRYLRESPDPNSPRLPPFPANSGDRALCERLNIFLVILNAEIKFRRYFEMIKQDPPSRPLPHDVTELMHRTMDLVDLIYWRPVPTKGSKGEAAASNIHALRRQYEGRAARPNHAKLVEGDSSEEVEMGDQDEDFQTLPGQDRVQYSAAARRRELDWLASADLETRKAYGRALMSGHDLDYDEALFEDAFPLNDTHIYSEPATVEAWKQGVSAESSKMLA